jgi:predicted  nucleic acid-binding Zn-ribbon protein
MQSLWSGRFVAGICVMTQLDETAQRLTAALAALESALPALLEARARAARDEAEIARLGAERDRLAARIGDLEDETRTLGGLTEEVETRLDGAISEIRQALAR